jgi:hypothetical protein
LTGEDRGPKEFAIVGMGTSTIVALSALFIYEKFNSRGNSMKTKNISNLPLVAYLSVLGHKIIEMSSSNERSTFTFEDSEDLGKSILNFYNRLGQVEPLTYSEVLRNLKSMALKR